MKLSDVDLPSNKKFGVFFAAIFFLAGTYYFYVGSQTVSYIFVVLAFMFLLTALLRAKLLLPLNKLWMRFGLVLGMIVSPIVLGILFFGLFTPIALIMRLSGRDELRLKMYSGKSQWKSKEFNTDENLSFEYQF